MATIFENHETERPHRELATRDRMLLFVLIFATVITAYLIYLLVQPFLPALAWAFALAIVAKPLHRWIRGKVHRTGLAAGITAALIAILILGPALFVTQQVTSQAIAALEWIRDEDKIAEWREAAGENARFAAALEWAEKNVDVAGQVEQFLGFFTESMTGLLAGTVWLGMQLLIMLLSLFFFLRDSAQVLGSVQGLVPLSNREANKVFRRVDDTIHATVFGTVTVAIVQGFMGAVIFFLLGIPGALLWGVIMGLLSIIPYLGAFVIWGPVAAYLALSGDWTRAIILTVYGLTAIGLIDNLLYPVLVGKRMRMHTLVAFFAILGGVSAFGMTGVVIGPVIVAIALALVEIWRQRTADGQGAENAREIEVVQHR